MSSLLGCLVKLDVVALSCSFFLPERMKEFRPKWQKSLVQWQNLFSRYTVGLKLCTISSCMTLPRIRLFWLSQHRHPESSYFHVL